MKKTISLLVVFLLLLSLCACGNSNNQNTEPSGFSKNATGNTEDSTQETTEATQATTEESTTASTEEPTTAPLDEMDTKPADTSKPTHTHSYSAATCTQPKKCSCGATDGSALGHTWTPATCTVPKTCSVCKATEGSAAGHDWSDATCTAPKTCKTCKATEGSAAGHSYKDATCTTPKTCSVCNATEGAALGHKWTDATCTAPKTCSICKKTEGSEAEHIVEGTTCKWCKKVVPINPTSFNPNIAYSCISKCIEDNTFEGYYECDIYYLTYLHFDGEESRTDIVFDTTGVNREEATRGQILNHNGVAYKNICMGIGFNGETTYNISGSEIAVSIETWGGDIVKVSFQLLSNGTLKITAISFNTWKIQEHTGLYVGAIFYPNLNPYTDLGV